MNETVELRLGVYATPGDRDRLVDRLGSWLRERRGVRDWTVEVREAHVRLDGALTVAEMYEDLAEQWRAEQPGGGPGDRALYELYAEAEVDPALLPDPAEALGSELPRLACPDLEHPGPCPVPWSSACWVREPGER
ncbi:hypothetical protein ACSNOI_23795 [Actinomadura kijaniata]|uniref:hypothetical protein n=1 Tax=Actinomadura kijaniata TaxID=46161 RepID=UPI003F1D1049